MDTKGIQAILSPLILMMADRQPLTTWEWHVAPDDEAGSVYAASRMRTAWQDKPSLLLCAATGNSPTRTYQLFVESILAERTQATGLRVLKLDEWGGLPVDDPATCEVYLRDQLVSPLGITEERFVGFLSDASSPDDECRRVGHWLDRNGPIDLCVLGLGINGHLGFNEPAEALEADCHVANLTPETLSHAMLARASRRPSHGLTVGMKAILASREILLLVFGESKAGPLECLTTGGITPRCPASFLALHQKVVCVCDEAAASRLCLDGG